MSNSITLLNILLNDDNDDYEETFNFEGNVTSSEKFMRYCACLMLIK